MPPVARPCTASPAPLHTEGIQATWKDDVTQENVIFGGIYVGADKTWEKTYANAVLENNGDIVLCPAEQLKDKCGGACRLRTPPLNWAARA